MLIKLKKIFAHSTALNYGRHIIKNWAARYQARSHEVTVIDLGCGVGDDLLNVKNSLEDNYSDKSIALHGIEYFQPYIQAATARGITIHSLNIENQPLPFVDGSVDMVLANQILEHTKDIFWICSEVSRVLKPGGEFIVGVPNLAAWHNRLMLFIGLQPASITVLSAHVRGYTVNGFRSFIETDQYFKLQEYRGSNFYPFLPPISRWLANILPRLAVTTFYRVQRTEKHGNFIQVLDTRNFETNYFRGNTGT